MDRQSPMIEPPAVEVTDLTVHFRLRDRTVHAVNGISFRLARGEVLGILGESGSGKSVTLRALMRLLPANCEIGGQIFLDGEDVNGASGASRRSARWPHRSDLSGADYRLCTTGERPPAG
jgi:peptide/nickel transport system ATP-binding protein